MTRACSLDGQLPNLKNMTKSELGNRIAFMVGTILEGVNERHPHSMDELLHKKELGNNTYNCRHRQRLKTTSSHQT
jgi:hypothetical protein